jgi:hypothetical protein
MRSTVVASLILTVAGANVGYADEAEDRAAALVKELGGSALRDEKAEGRPIIRIHLKDRKLSPDDMRILAACRQLAALELFSCPVAPDALKELAPLQKLQRLELNTCGVTDAGLEALAGLTQLENVFLLGNPITDAGVKHLAGMKKLQWLNLSFTRITDAGLHECAAFGELRSLHVSNTKIGDAGLKELAGLKKLQRLNLGDTSVTDAGLKQLTGLTALEVLDLGGTKVTAQGIEEIQKALPKCQIVRPPSLTQDLVPLLGERSPASSQSSAPTLGRPEGRTMRWLGLGADLMLAGLGIWMLLMGYRLIGKLPGADETYDAAMASQGRNYRTVGWCVVVMSVIGLFSVLGEWFLGGL